MKISNCIILIILICTIISGQSSGPAVDDAEKKTVIDSVIANLEREYIFPEVTRKYVKKLKQYLKSGRYDGINDPDEFADKLTEDLTVIHKDEHLHIWYNPEWIKNERRRKAGDETALFQKERRERSANYGFEEIKILPGNVGYLKLNSFSYNTNAFEAATGAMNFLSNADAVIIDLRENGGGSPEMVQFLCSYFLENPRQHLNSFYHRDQEDINQYWTYTYLPGKRLDKVDLYLLTGRRTFSAAEEFSYNLKHLKRAIVIGETSSGGAHDNKFIILNDNFEMGMPFARAVNPVTGANWEGVGVEPDIKVPSDMALVNAQLLAMEKMSEKEEDPVYKRYYLWMYELYNTVLHPVFIDTDILNSYVGTYGPRTITYEDGSLFYQREGRSRMKMVPVSQDFFMFKEIDSFRLKFLIEDNNVIGVEGYTSEGPADRHLKDK